ncbi:F-box only protein 21-like [Cataglyphis hispanica]|uniref:F-box only protein 21-like n=1 Tax=Cataglyphis hispanica TaxID=1086592 RepID=UPI00217F2D65|nr:F-box only protein 21-like [Cataglyphis hispanica]
MSTMISLPNEIIAKILEDDGISIKDVVNFSSTCKRFRQTVQNKRLWETKFYQRCPSARKRYSLQERKKISYHLDFREEIEAGIKFVKNLQFYVILLSKNNSISYNDKENLHYLLQTIAKNSIVYFFVSDELNRIISAELPWQPGSNLTNMYYIDRIFYSLKQHRFEYKQNKFLSAPKNELLLEQRVTTAAQYFYPHISYSVIKMWLDEIEREALSRLKQKTSSQLTVSEPFIFCTQHTCQASDKIRVQIVNILEEIIISELGIKKLHKLFITLNLEDIYIINISQRFRNFLLTIVFYIVATRMGIHCKLIECDGYVGIELPDFTCENIWGIHNWNSACFYINEDIHSPINIVREIYKYKCILFPQNHALAILMKHMYEEIIDYTWKSNFLYIFLAKEFIYSRNITQEIYSNIQNMFQTKNILKKIEQKRRNENIKFAVGMIVTHSVRLSTSTEIRAGVIVGWYLGCNSLAIESLCIPHIYYNLDCCSCEKAIEYACHPHYVILNEANTLHYVPQDNISTCPPQWINNVEIGRYFIKFEGTHYAPNEILAERYPDDTAVILKIFSNTVSRFEWLSTKSKQ